MPLKKLDIDVFWNDSLQKLPVTISIIATLWLGVCFSNGLHRTNMLPNTVLHSTSFTDVQWWWILSKFSRLPIFSSQLSSYFITFLYEVLVLQLLYVLCSFSHKNLRCNSKICKIWVTPGVLAMRLQKCHALVLIRIFSIVYPNLANTFFHTKAENASITNMFQWLRTLANQPPDSISHSCMFSIFPRLASKIAGFFFVIDFWYGFFLSMFTRAGRWPDKLWFRYS